MAGGGGLEHELRGRGTLSVSAGVFPIPISD